MENLISALLKAQTQIDHATKDAKNPFYKSDYATLEQVINTVKEPLNENGIYFQQNSTLTETGATCETIFYGHSAQLSAGVVYVPADKLDPQAFGSALTYARRYSLSMACGISSKDDDGESAMQRSRVTKKPSKYNLMRNDNAVVSTDDEEEFLKHLQRMLKEPTNVVCQKLYKENSKIIKTAHDNSTGTVQESFAKCIEMYEQE